MTKTEPHSLDCFNCFNGTCYIQNYRYRYIYHVIYHFISYSVVISGHNRDFRRLENDFRYFCETQFTLVRLYSTEITFYHYVSWFLEYKLPRTLFHTSAHGGFYIVDMSSLCTLHCVCFRPTQIARFTGPTWGPTGSCRPLMGPMLATWTLLSGYHCFM